MDALQLSFWTLAITPTIVALIAVPASRSRRRLVVALSVAIPVAGPILAVLVARVRGTGERVEPGDQPEPERPALDLEQVRRLGEMPSLLELLVSDRPADRQAALVVLSSRADADAVKMLRWAVDHGSADAVLDAALALSELDLRFEHELAAAEEALDEHRIFDNAMAVADTLSRAIHCGLADPAIAIGLAERARDLYEQALEMEDARAEDAELALARLELVAGAPRAALTRLENVLERTPEPTPDLERLYERACFRARQLALPPTDTHPRLRGF